MSAVGDSKSEFFDHTTAQHLQESLVPLWTHNQEDSLLDDEDDGIELDGAMMKQVRAVLFEDNVPSHFNNIFSSKNNETQSNSKVSLTNEELYKVITALTTLCLLSNADSHVTAVRDLKAAYIESRDKDCCPSISFTLFGKKIGVGMAPKLDTYHTIIPFINHAKERGKCRTRDVLGEIGFSFEYYDYALSIKNSASKISDVTEQVNNRQLNTKLYQHK